MDLTLNEVCDYCSISEDGKKILEKNYNPKEIVSEFELNKDQFKYMNFISFLAKFGFDLNGSKNRYLYHYLFKNDLINILKSRKFYIGKQEDMNDPREKYYAMDRFRVFLLKKKSDAKLIDKTFQDLFFKTPYWTYIWSFTSDRNSMAMQNYGDVAIRIKATDIYTELQNKNNEFRCGQENIIPLTPPLLLPIKVCYSNNVHNEYLNYLADMFSSYFHKDNQKGMQDVVDYLKFYSMVFKNPVLKEEKEIRFIINRPLFMNKKPFDTKFRDKYKLIGLITPEILTSITVNHKTDSWYQGKQINTISDTMRDLKYVLEDEGFSNTRVGKTQLLY